MSNFKETSSFLVLYTFYSLRGYKKISIRFEIRHLKSTYFSQLLRQKKQVNNLIRSCFLFNSRGFGHTFFPLKSVRI